MRLRSLASICLAALFLGPLPVLGQAEISAPAFGSDARTLESTPDPRAAFIAQYDDGSPDIFFTPGDSTTTYEIAMLFEGVGGEDVTLGSVEFCWRQTGSDPRIRYEVVLWAPNGPGGAPGTELASFAAVAEGVGSAADFYNTPIGVPLDEEDVFIGVRFFKPVDPDAFFCLDDDGIGGAPAQPGFRRFDESGSWGTISSFYPPYRALMIRAFLSTPGVVADRLLVPAFAVDTSDAAGTTTLFAVRNLTDSPLSVGIDYFEQDGTFQRSDNVNLGPRDTETYNIRDIPGLVAGPDGFRRGYIEIIGPGDPDGVPLFAGDYIQLDPGDDFATGEQTRRRVCTMESIRFFDFGDGTRLGVWIQNPRGVGMADPESFSVQVLDEDGNLDVIVDYFTTRNSFELEASDFTSLAFGTLIFDFTNSGGGMVFGEFSAGGRFSIGFDSECENP